MTTAAAPCGEPPHSPVSSTGAESSVAGADCAPAARVKSGVHNSETPAPARKCRRPIAAFRADVLAHSPPHPPPHAGEGTEGGPCLTSVRRQHQRVVLQQIVQIELADAFEIDD